MQLRKGDSSSVPSPPGPSASSEELESVTARKQRAATVKASLGILGPFLSRSFLQPQLQLGGISCTLVLLRGSQHSAAPPWLLPGTSHHLFSSELLL